MNIITWPEPTVTQFRQQTYINPVDRGMQRRQLSLQGWGNLWTRPWQQAHLLRRGSGGKAPRNFNLGIRPGSRFFLWLGVLQTKRATCTSHEPKRQPVPNNPFLTTDPTENTQEYRNILWLSGHLLNVIRILTPNLLLKSSRSLCQCRCQTVT